MNIPDYEYVVEDCDIPAVRRPRLRQYREFRTRCLTYMRSDLQTSVMNQVHDMTWNTAVFRVLNESLRLQPDRRVNGALWELMTEGYASLMALGIRRLVDRDPQTDSLWTVIDHVRKHPEFLTRELFICYDGLSFDYEKAQRDCYAGQDLSKAKDGVIVTRLSVRGSTGWAMAEMMDKAFDRMTHRAAGQRKRLDSIDPDLLDRLTDELQHPSIETVRTMANKRYAHAERFPTADAIPTVTYNDIDDALRRIVRVANFLSSHFFYDATFGSVVATPQFNVLESLDHPWVTSGVLPELHRHWDEVCAAMDRWAYDTDKGFLPPVGG